MQTAELFSFTRVITDESTLYKITNTIHRLSKRYVKRLSLETFYDYMCCEVRDLCNISKCDITLAYNVYLLAINQSPDYGFLLVAALRKLLPEEFWELELSNPNIPQWVKTAISMEREPSHNDMFEVWAEL